MKQDSGNSEASKGYCDETPITKNTKSDEAKGPNQKPVGPGQGSVSTDRGKFNFK